MDKTQSGKKQITIGLTWSAASGSARAVIVSRDGQTIREIQSSTVSSAEQWKELLGRYGSPSSAKLAVNVGLNSSQVGFYDFPLPPVSAEQLPLIVRSQAEGCLPLPLGQMQYAWRMDRRDTNKHCVLAAVRKDVLDRLKTALPGREFDTVIPDIQALVDCWNTCYESTMAPSILLAVSDHEAAVILTEGHSIRHVVRVDIDPEPSAAVLWMGDILQAIRLEQTLSAEAAVFLLAVPNSDVSAIIYNQLGQEGRSVSLCRPDQQKLRQLGIENNTLLLEYPKETALALLEPEGSTCDFDFTCSQSVGKEQKQTSWAGRWLSVLLSLLVAVLVLAGGMYWKDQMELKQLETLLSETQGENAVAALLARQEYRKQIARVRPDLIELLTVLQKAQPEDVFLDSLLFDLHKPVEIKGQAPSYEKAYEFHKNLTGSIGIGQVRLIEPTLDEKSKKVSFTIRFSYRHFSQ